MSGAAAERPVLLNLMNELRAGDVLIIWKLDRLGRSLQHLIAIVNDLLTRKVGLKSLTDPIDTTTATGRLTFNILLRSLNLNGTSFENEQGPGWWPPEQEDVRADDQKESLVARNRPPAPPKRCIGKANSVVNRSPIGSAFQRVRSIRICVIAA
jgi:hypothetical protein